MAPGASGRSLTLLHLSDLQFGREHAFGGRARLPEDGRFDTLLQRLSDDLVALNRDEGLIPDVVIVTGDLAEWALPAELEDVRRFTEGLRQLLDLPTDRFVLLPGNHDVNRKLCHAHVLQAEARGLVAHPPYWPKWEPFVDMLARFHGDDTGLVFTEGRPYTLFEYPDLRLVVAALNSTMAESHRDEDHHGWLGETQLRWFAERLREHESRGWLRVAALHHNLFPGHVGDDELLHDRDDFERWIVPHVNLVLHGHTHDGKLQWLRPDVPVLSTGSAAVLPGARAPGIPNQYQYIRIDADGLQRWCRAYDSAHQRWIGDLTIGDGNEWRMRQPVSFVGVEGTFPRPRDGQLAASPSPELELPLGPEAELLEDVAETLRAREPEAKIRVVTRGLHEQAWLRVERTAGGVTEVLPVGAVVGTVDDAALERFLDRVHRPARARGLASVSELVYGGAPPPAAVEARARAERVRLRSFAELQGLIDFRRYVAAQTRRLAEDPSYPPAGYVPQRMRQRVGRELLPHADALASIREWVQRDEGCFVLVLGDFGVGKTFLLHELARRLGEVEGGPVPIFIELRKLEKGTTLEQLLAQHFARHEFEGYAPSRFRHMLESGRIVLVFDGFDELVVRVTYASAVEHFDTLVRAAQGRAKVVVTSRRQHFLTDDDVRKVLMEHVDWVPSSRVVLMSGFDRGQIESFLRGRLSPQGAARRLEQIGEIRDLMGLSENPRMLSFIAELSEPELLAARDQSGMISAAALYRQLLRRWLGHELERRDAPGAAPGLTHTERWQAVEALAERLWRSGQPALPVEALIEQAAALVSLAQSTEEAGFQIGSGTLLVRDEVGRFSFVHQSVMEWLVASVAARRLEGGHAPEILEQARTSPLMADFLVDLATPAACLRWATQTLNTRGASEHARRNALLLRERAKRAMGAAVSTGAKLRELLASGGALDLAGESLQDEDVEGLDLSGAVLRDALLRGLRAAGADLRGADLRRANLAFADLSGADLRGAKLQGATLTRARLGGARLEGADLRGATLLGARELPPLDGVDARGAALDGRPPASYVQRPEGFVRRLSVAVEAGLAVSCTSGTVIVHELDTLRRIRCFRVEGLVDAVLVRGGTRLVVASESDVRIVDPETGAVRARYELESPVRLAVDPASSTFVVGLASGTLVHIDTHAVFLADPALDHGSAADAELPLGWPLAGIGGGRVARYLGTKAIALVDILTGALLDTIEPPRSGVLRVFKRRSEITAASLAPSGSKLAIAVGDRLHVLDRDSGWRGPTLEIPGPAITTVRWSADEAHLLLTTASKQTYCCSSTGQGGWSWIGTDPLVADPTAGDPAVVAWPRSMRLGRMTYSRASIDIVEAKVPPPPSIGAWKRARGGMIVSYAFGLLRHAWDVARGIRTQYEGIHAALAMDAPTKAADSPSQRLVALRLGDALEIYDARELTAPLRGAPLRRIAPIDARHVLFLHDEIIATRGLGPGIEIRRWRTNELLVTLLSAPSGWAAIAPDGRFKAHGDLDGLAWHAVGLKRFDLGELDDAMPELRLPDDHVFVPELLEP